MSKIHKPITVHFVCRGNTFRSRLAAAYFATLSTQNFIISSSGIDIHNSPVRSSQPNTKYVAKLHGLTYQIATSKQQTTNELLVNADIIVLMNDDVWHSASMTFNVDARKTIVWHVKDVDPAMKAEAARTADNSNLNQFAEQTYKHIKRLCDELYGYLTDTSWVDIVDEHNIESGLRLPVAWANDRGLWHRGIHVVVRTDTDKYVVGKRSNTIVFAPGMLEISLGGAVDSGEHPLTAAQREMHEELGIVSPQSNFKPLFKHAQHSFHPRTKKLSRVHLYVYVITVPAKHLHLILQPTEVADARLISRRQVQQLVRTHRLKHLGRLKGGYKFYNKVLASATNIMAS